jgi:hypothetical protein
MRDDEWGVFLASVCQAGEIAATELSADAGRPMISGYPLFSGEVATRRLNVVIRFLVQDNRGLWEARFDQITLEPDVPFADAMEEAMTAFRWLGREIRLVVEQNGGRLKRG